jgi:uncharacterized repeat protein (TIGR01451 family)
VLVGDFNAYEFNDGLGDSMNVIRGTPPPDNETAVPGDGVDLVNPDLDNLFDTPPPGQRYSYVFDGQTQNIDHVLVNAALVSATAARRVEHPRLNADFPAVDRNDPATPRHLSDHDPIVAYFELSGFVTADLSVAKVESADPVTAGATLAYTITVTNAGPDPAATVQWSDTLPAGATFAALTPSPGWSCTPPPGGSGGTVTCSIGTLPVGSAVFSLSVTVDPSVPVGTVLSNTATLTSTTPDPDTGDLTATETTTVGTSADLSVTKDDAADPVFPGDDLAYTITVANAGPSNAEAVTLTDPLPAGTTFVSLSSPVGWSCGTPPVGGSGALSCSILSLGVGSGAFTLTVNVAPGTANGTVLSNTAHVTSATFDPSGAPNDTETTTVATGLDYYTLAPCRVLDTRTTVPLLAGEIRSFDVTGGACLVPAASKAVVANVTVVNPASNGHLLAFKAGVAPPGAGLIVQMRPGLTRGTHGMVALGDDLRGQMSIRNASSGPTHVVVDVAGYFLP